MVYFGALQYSPALIKVLQEHAEYHDIGSTDISLPDSLARETAHTLPHKSDLEMQIRGNSIWAVELLRRCIASKVSVSPNAILIDFYIWDFTTQNRDMLKSVPFHKTRSIYY